MAKYTLTDVLSTYGNNPDILSSDNDGLAYTTMVAYAAETAGGIFLVELGTGGLARAFHKAITSTLVRMKLAEDLSDLASAAAFAMAEEYVEAMRARAETINNPNSTYMFMITSALTMAGHRFLHHEADTTFDFAQQWRELQVHDPDEYGPVLLAWFNRPIPFSCKTALRNCA